MRRILNLNQPGVVFAKIIGLFVLVIPAVLYGILLFLSESETANAQLRGAVRVSFGIGAFLFVVLLILIIAEQIQDHYIDVQYQKSRDRKLTLGNGNYECQYCGNRKVRENDRICQVCGRVLQ